MTTLGIFVGGASRRMGGRPKGLLPAPDTGEPLVARAARLAREAGLSPCLVGHAGNYRALLPDLAALDDDPPGIGPLGGLRALLRGRGPRVIALACDMPYLRRETLVALRNAPDDHLVVAPRRHPDAPWEPLLARYDRAVLRHLEAALHDGDHSLQSLLRRTGVHPLPCDPAELTDWDSPRDLP